MFNLAVGVTKQITGDVTIDYTNPQNSTIGTITIDISQFTSDSNRRDNLFATVSWNHPSTRRQPSLLQILKDCLPW